MLRQKDEHSPILETPTMNNNDRAIKKTEPDPLAFGCEQIPDRGGTPTAGQDYREGKR